MFEYSRRFKRVYLVADRDDGMYNREKQFARFLEMCDLYVELKEINEIDYTERVGIKRLKSFLPINRVLYIVSRTRLKLFCNYSSAGCMVSASM